MIRSASPHRARVDELLVDRALFGLHSSENAELEALLTNDDILDPDCYDRTAAAIDLALGPNGFEPLPATLAARVRKRAAVCLARPF